MAAIAFTAGLAAFNAGGALTAALGGTVGLFGATFTGLVATSFLDQRFIYPTLFGKDETQPESLDGFELSTAGEGAPTNLVFGRQVRVPGQVVWIGDIILHQSSGSKGAGPGRSGMPNFFADVAFKFATGTKVEDVTTIWADATILYNRVTTAQAADNRYKVEAMSFTRPFAIGPTPGTQTWMEIQAISTAAPVLPNLFRLGFKVHTSNATDAGNDTGATPWNVTGYNQHRLRDFRFGIASCTGSGTEVTVNLTNALASGRVAGLQHPVRITGLSGSPDANGTFLVTWDDVDTFRYDLGDTAAASYGATGARAHSAAIVYTGLNVANESPVTRNPVASLAASPPFTIDEDNPNAGNAQINTELATDLNVYDGDEKINLDFTREPQSADAIIVATEGGENVHPMLHHALVTINGLLLNDFGNRVPNFQVQAVIDSQETYRSAVRGIATLAIDPSMVDVSGVDEEPLYEYNVRGPQKVTTALQPLMVAQDIVAFEDRGTIRFLQRRNVANVTVRSAAVAAHPARTNAPPRISIEGQSPNKLLKEVRVYYRDIDDDNARKFERERAEDVVVDDVETVELPIGMTRKSARAIATRLLWTTRAGHQLASFTLPPSYMYVTPNDRLAVPDASREGSPVFDIRITKVERGNNGLISCEGVVQNDPNLSPTVLEEDVPEVPDTPTDPIDPITEFANFNNTSHQFINDTQPTRFDPDLSGGAHSHRWNGGPIGKALTAFIGDTQHDSLCLSQIQSLLIETNGVTVPGEFPEQKQTQAYILFLLAKHTPRIWDALTAAEQLKIERTFQSCLAMNAYMTCDEVNATTTFRGGVWSRTFNPNLVGGGMWNLILAILYFGSANAQDILNNWDQASWISNLLGWGLEHIHRTWTHANAPSAATFDAGVNPNYEFSAYPTSGIWASAPATTIFDPLELYVRQTWHLTGGTISPGLNGGAGQVGANGERGGYMTNPGNPGRLGLPDIGRPESQFHEFNTSDGGGPRSSAHYTWDGASVNLYPMLALCALGFWESNPNTEKILDALEYSWRDWEYKNDLALGGGWHNYQHGNGDDDVYPFPDNGSFSGNAHWVTFNLFKILMDWHERDHGYVRKVATPSYGGAIIGP